MSAIFNLSREWMRLLTGFPACSKVRAFSLSSGSMPACNFVGQRLGDAESLEKSYSRTLMFCRIRPITVFGGGNKSSPMDEHARPGTSSPCPTSPTSGSYEEGSPGSKSFDSFLGSTAIEKSSGVSESLHSARGVTQRVYKP